MLFRLKSVREEQRGNLFALSCTTHSCASGCPVHEFCVCAAIMDAILWSRVLSACVTIREAPDVAGVCSVFRNCMISASTWENSHVDTTMLRFNLPLVRRLRRLWRLAASLWALPAVEPWVTHLNVPIQFAWDVSSHDHSYFDYNHGRSRRQHFFLSRSMMPTEIKVRLEWSGNMNLVWWGYTDLTSPMALEDIISNMEDEEPAALQKYVVTCHGQMMSARNAQFNRLWYINGWPEPVQEPAVNLRPYAATRAGRPRRQHVILGLKLRGDETCFFCNDIIVGRLPNAMRGSGCRFCLITDSYSSTRNGITTVVATPLPLLVSPGVAPEAWMVCAICLERSGTESLATINCSQCGMACCQEHKDDRMSSSGDITFCRDCAKLSYYQGS